MDDDGSDGFYLGGGKEIRLRWMMVMVINSISRGESCVHWCTKHTGTDITTLPSSFMLSHGAGQREPCLSRAYSCALV